jgi:hypothetical protein
MFAALSAAVLLAEPPTLTIKTVLIIRHADAREIGR